MAENIELVKIRDRAQAFHQRWVSKGGKLCNYVCPCCKQTIETIRPTRAAVGQQGFWDSLKTCIGCGEIAMVRTYPTGRTIAWVFAEESPTGKADR